MTWDSFARKVKFYQRGYMGEPDEIKPGRGEFQEYPYSCICKKTSDDDASGNRTTRNRNIMEKAGV